ncbi:hypothetical protein [Hymenobacter sp. BT559]|uniref:hypothetical protein n=1 Tax=Hymenobacter sp. BT559 TaxID=2795729 RepID=UPI0018EA7C51|nr:hypothetical protein [Hymenobacter sp. BT559]MBJ6143960.1 hypothetical protein [Hymenobacter sp. BT559]
MKKILTATLPALAALALGGCATTGAISSTEDDGVYYSSADRTTVTPYAARPQTDGYGYETARAQTQTTQTTEDANPDYQGGTQGTDASTDYYDDSYTSASPSGFGQPYTGPGVSTYNYTPTWSVSPSFYGSPFGYGTGLSFGYGLGGFGGYSPFGYGLGYPGYAGFYDPFFSPYGYGSAFSLGFGYGFGGFGNPYGFGSPFGYGYSPYYAYGRYPYGGGGYYGGNYYEGGYGGARRYVYKNAIVNGGYPNGYDRNAIRVGRREGRATNAVGAGGGVVAPGGNGTNAPSGVIGGRRVVGGAASGFGNATAPAPGQLTGNDPTAVTGAQPTTGGRRFDQPTVNPNSPSPNGRGGWRSMDAGANGGYNQPRSDAAATNPGAPQPRRGGFFRDVFGAQPNGGGNNGAQNGFSQPQQRGFSQPQQQQRAYSQPDRGFQQQRMEQRSFQPAPAPAPSFGGGGGGGGAAGGFGGGGGGRRGR